MNLNFLHLHQPSTLMHSPTAGDCLEKLPERESRIEEMSRRPNVYPRDAPNDYTESRRSLFATTSITV